MINKNEKNQFKLFKKLLNKYSKKNKNDLFYDFKSVEEVIGNQQAHDATVYMKDNTIVSVELTTMGNLVAKTSRNKHQNPIKMQLTLPFFISDDKNLQKNLKNLKGQEINREIKEIKEFNYGKKISYSDEFVQLLPGEKDYDKKYSVESGKLINALYRALKPKLEKKYSKTQINKRVLVVLNESRDNFKIPHNILH